ncbi:beta-N-acetylhexosaminidase [Treponema phagedenis]|uniref:beta-N-acetylhexosaminidase n=1 Tax=Treponema phagedenis TaxID=162 RepID=UPI0011EBABFF|nr:beta-N-acetylhexosaminidase [Treponema phagedenis]TYT77914.1 beta-N-acetylhexosaminidase [Treponema phagedenis]
MTDSFLSLLFASLSEDLQAKLISNPLFKKKRRYVQIENEPHDIAVLDTEDAILLQYTHPYQAGRCIALFFESLAFDLPLPRKEKSRYQSLGLMIDCSRNGVLLPAAFKRLLPHLSLMGYSSVQLYMEDTFTIDEYPYFGYQRGRYTQNELRELDAYAKEYGIELIPAVQTLAHLQQVLKWQAFANLRDCNDILLIGSEETYAFISAMFKSLTESVSSKKINIGMDEAAMVGLGRYLDLHGYTNRYELMLRHFRTVHALAEKQGFTSVYLWSDVFFKLATGESYFSKNLSLHAIDKNIAADIPAGSRLLFWDYALRPSEDYELPMQIHKAFCNNAGFAAGAWKWASFFTCNQFSIAAAVSVHGAAKKTGIQELLVTAWGDDGNEASLFSVLPAVSAWAELCWADSLELLPRRFALCCNADFESFLSLDEPILTPDNPAPGKCTVNPSKYILYQDILAPLFESHIQGESTYAHYRQCAEKMKQAEAKNPAWKELFQTGFALSDILAEKSILPQKIRRAYEAKDSAKLKEIAEKDLPALAQKIQNFISIYSRQWQAENKIFGLDVFDLRMGGLLQRITRAQERLVLYAKGTLRELPELNQKPLSFDPEYPNAMYSPGWKNIATASVL